MTTLDAIEITAILGLALALVITVAWIAIELTALKNRLAHAPSHDDVRAIRDRIAEMAGQMTALTDRQTVSMDMIRSIQTHLLGTDQ